MKISKKLISPTLNSAALIFILAVILFGCEKEREELPDPVIATVGNSSLLKSELDSSIGASNLKPEHREEFIRRWIEREMLYKEAIDNGIRQTSEFKLTVENSKKELAVAIYLNKFFSDRAVEVSNEELKKFYNSHTQDFILSESGFVINFANFSNIKSAVDFRTELFDSDEKFSRNYISRIDSINSFEINKLYLMSELPSAKFVRVLNNLLPGEISIVFESEPNIFTVVQLIDVIEERNVPDYEFIEPLVEERYQMIKRKQIYSDFIKELYSKYNVGINRDIK